MPRFCKFLTAVSHSSLSFIQVRRRYFSSFFSFSFSFFLLVANRMCSQQCCNGADERSEKSIDRTHFQVSSSRFGSNELGLFHSLSRYKLKFSPDKVKSLNIWPLKFCICTQNLFGKACFVFGKDET